MFDPEIPHIFLSPPLSLPPQTIPIGEGREDNKMLPPPPHRLNLVFSVHLLYQMCREDTYHKFYSDVKVENHICSTYYYWQAASGNENHISNTY